VRETVTVATSGKTRILPTLFAVAVCLGVSITGSILVGIESRIWMPAVATVGTVVGVVAFRKGARTP
jgi:hypothetical protein